MVLCFDHREKGNGEVANEQVFIPGILPKIPGWIYYLFGKPIQTHGRGDHILKDREKAVELYLQIKSEVEHSMAYLLKKWEEDPYRSIFNRVVYQVFHSPHRDIPGFKPD
ncbi:hypothetical protein SAY87_026995 [Trapa incisa]|uniref:Uncharacterized protein n=1 Tax=Trapa incisa TaxID=236973 RepID=A0AAN7GMM5_9MYRT|nr:hypothetical protein SAY87_026995 [Trapa incisa]